MLKIIQLIKPPHKDIGIQTDQRYFGSNPNNLIDSCQNKKLNLRRMQELSKSYKWKSKQKSSKIQYNQLSHADTCNNSNYSTLTFFGRTKQNIDRRRLQKNKKAMITKQTFLQRSERPKIEQKQNYKQKTCFSWKESDQKINVQKKRLKQTKNTNHLSCQLQSMQKNTRLKQLYDSLYKLYESVPFNQKQKEYIQSQENTVKNLAIQQQKSSQLMLETKYKLKKEQIQLKFQESIRKEIKSLTRDTNHILSIQFKQLKKA